MSQHDYVIANASGSAVRTDLNNALGAIQTTNIGSSAPSALAAGQLWIDNSATPWVLKVYDGSDHISIGTINATTNAFEASGSSGVTTPGSTTDHAVVRWNGSDGSTIQSSRVLISDANAITGCVSINFGDATLANYEVGTWSPDLYGLTTAGTRGYSTQTGTYTRIGRMVFIQFQMNMNAWSGAAGQAAIQGLPFAVTSAINVQPTLVGYSANVDIPGTAGEGWSLNPAASTSKLDTNYYEEGDSSGGGALQVGDFHNNSQVRFNGSYFTDAA